MTQVNPALFHVIETGPFDRALLENLCELTTAVRTVAKSREGASGLQSLLAHKRAMLYFTQASTRTFLSFNNACHILGMRTSEIRDPSISSEVNSRCSRASPGEATPGLAQILMRSAPQAATSRTRWRQAHGPSTRLDGRPGPANQTNEVESPALTGRSPRWNTMKSFSAAEASGDSGMSPFPRR